MTAVRQDKLVNALVGDFARVTHTHVGGSLTFVLNDATDVQITSADLGDYLRYNGVGQWVDVAVGQVLSDILGADATLAALAAFNTNGLLTQTAADTFTGRSIAVGAGGYLSVSNGNGVSGNPTLDLADAELLALAGLTSAANQLPYFTGSGTAALTTLSAFMRTLLDDADAATARTTLEVAVGTNVQAYDAFLTSIAALGTAADRMIYTTGIDTAAETALTAFARSILDDADEATFKATVNLEIGVDVQAYDAELAALAGLTSAANALPYFTGSGTAAVTTLSAYARTFLDDADEATFKATVNLEIGVDVQAHDSDLDALATLAATAGMLSRTGANAFAARTLTAPAAGFTITNNTGAAGNPTFVLANDLGALEGLASTGIAVRSATDTWVQRSIAAGTGIGITNGDGVSGNPTVAITDAELLALAGLTSAADKLPYFTGSGTAALADFSAFIRTLTDDADASTARTTLGVAYTRTTWTPTMTQSGSVTVTVTRARYIIGDDQTVHAQALLSITGSGTTNNAIVIAGIPAAISIGGATNDGTFAVGYFVYYDAQAGHYYTGIATSASSTSLYLNLGGDVSGLLGIVPNFGASNGDILCLNLTYEH